MHLHRYAICVGISEEENPAEAWACGPEFAAELIPNAEFWK